MKHTGTPRTLLEAIEQASGGMAPLDHEREIRRRVIDFLSQHFTIAMVEAEETPPEVARLQQLYSRIIAMDPPVRTEEES